MKIIKRNGAEVGFDITKIIIAITKANESVAEADRMTPMQIQRIAESVDSPPGMLTEDHHHTVHEERQVWSLCVRIQFKRNMDVWHFFF